MNRSAPYVWDRYWGESINEIEDLTKIESTTWMLYKRLLNPFKLELQGKDFVELGCGSGINSLQLARDFGMHGVLVDYSDVALRFAKKASEIMGVYDVEFKKRIY